MFSTEAISRLSHHFSTQSTSDNIHHQVFHGYTKSFGQTEYCRFLNDVQIFEEIGELSSFSLRDQERGTSAVAELNRLVWTWGTLNSELPQGSVAQHNNIAAGVLNTMDAFKHQLSLENLTQDF